MPKNQQNSLEWKSIKTVPHNRPVIVQSVTGIVCLARCRYGRRFVRPDRYGRPVAYMFRCDKSGDITATKWMEPGDMRTIPPESFNMTIPGARIDVLGFMPAKRGNETFFVIDVWLPIQHKNGEVTYSIRKRFSDISPDAASRQAMIYVDTDAEKHRKRIMRKLKMRVGLTVRNELRVSSEE